MLWRSTVRISPSNNSFQTSTNHWLILINLSWLQFIWHQCLSLRSPWHFLTYASHDLGKLIVNIVESVFVLFLPIGTTGPLVEKACVYSCIHATQLLEMRILHKLPPKVDPVGNPRESTAHLSFTNIYMNLILEDDSGWQAVISLIFFTWLGNVDERCMSSNINATKLRPEKNIVGWFM